MGSRKRQEHLKTLRDCWKAHTASSTPSQWSKVEIRSYNVGEAVPVVKAIPQPEQLTEAAVAMEKRPKSLTSILAYAMMIVLEAHNHFNLVKQTTQWIDKVEWSVSDMCSTVADTSGMTKSEFIEYVETLDLGIKKYGKE
ncbi:LOW QUALITY PROTEIN: hypothetical protein PHMEG_0001635 [Phytophthora megakarya]|uniref:Uncharacterized protein n=1 Tax=Phytophthora megakarya TaxID=4795 RepID=A0A225X2J1_9STRA|nr:LOW QUALITY PROTEIN: hypothetical protein PHMEG_0001635 [Phytophthora megakarya]